MKTSMLPLALIALSLAGCATLSEPDREVLRQHRVSPRLYAKMEHQEQLSLPDIMELAERRVPAPFVVHYLQSTYAVYRMTSDDVMILRQAGVKREVIDYLMRTPMLFAPQYYGDPWWYGGDPYYPYGWGYSSDFVEFGRGDRHEHHHH